MPTADTLPPGAVRSVLVLGRPSVRAVATLLQPGPALFLARQGEIRRMTRPEGQVAIATQWLRGYPNASGVNRLDTDDILAPQSVDQAASEVVVTLQLHLLCAPFRLMPFSFRRPMDKTGSMDGWLACCGVLPSWLQQLVLVTQVLRAHNSRVFRALEISH
jgi:hypothetical protein